MMKDINTFARVYRFPHILDGFSMIFFFFFYEQLELLFKKDGFSIIE